ncbi:MAG: cobalamin-dependent protein [Acidimicrobiia bacterium]
MGASPVASDYIRILLGKPGLDGHDRGIKVVARALRDQGFEVIYSGLHKKVDTIAEIAGQENVDLVGISVLSGSHIPHTRDLRQALDERDMKDVKILVGGIIPDADIEPLRSAGADAIFAVGSNIKELGERIRELVGDSKKEPV